MRMTCLDELCDQQRDDLEAVLQTFDLNELLGSFHEFIETSVRYIPTDELDLK